MWPTTTRNRGKSGTPGRGNEIWEGLRPLSFFRSRHRPTPGHTMAPASAVSPRRPCRQAGPHGPPRRPGLGLSPLGVSLAAALWPSSGPKGMRRHENCPACPGRPPPGSGPRWLVVVGAWWCGAGPDVGRRRSAPVSFRRRPKRGGRSPPGQAQGSPGGRAWGLCGPPAVRFGRSPRGGCVVVGGVSAAPGGAGSPWPALARPRLGGCNWLAGGPPAPRRQGWARPPFRGPRCGPLWSGPVPPPFRPALLRSRRATVEEGSALPGARGFRRCGGGERPGGKAPGERARV